MGIETQGKAANNIVSVKGFTVRGTVYDRNMKPLTNTKTAYLTAALPTASAKSALKGKISKADYKKLTLGQAAVFLLDEKIECDGVSTYKIKVGGADAACHTVGYINGQGQGVCGIEAAYEGALSGYDIYADFRVDGKGKPLLGEAPVFRTVGQSAADVVTTLDYDIQKTVEQAGSDIKSGAIAVAESKTGKIRALASFPGFSPDSPADSINGENSPMLNKCLCAYSVGSVFKPLIAAAITENGLLSETVNCTGAAVIEGRTFNCHKHEGHGVVDLPAALKESCNCYFYNAAVILSPKTLYTYAERLNFGSRIRLAENIYTSPGSITAQDNLKSLSARANFCIGQGSIAISPVNMLTLYCAIANGGEYYLPTLTEKIIKDGKTNYCNTGAPTVAFQKQTAESIKGYLKEVINSGTGKAAKSEKITAAGKTATAQTGIVGSGGKETENSWFCGFFPADNPVYTVIIMTDKRGNTAPTQIFKEISESL